MKVKVKLCPFCGGVPEVHFFSSPDSESYATINCSNRKCFGYRFKKSYFSNVKIACDAWNFRASSGDGFVEVNVIKF